MLSAPVGAGVQTDLADDPDPGTTGPEIPPGQFYVSTAQLAHRFGVGAKWVNEHKLQLGATPISNSANSKLRYYLPTADAYMRGRTLTPVGKRRRPRVDLEGEPAAAVPDLVHRGALVAPQPIPRRRRGAPERVRGDPLGERLASRTFERGACCLGHRGE
ncbi:MAG: hypothetical protein WAU75_05860 [Solirubrobacteraceae bacterium]